MVIAPDLRRIGRIVYTIYGAVYGSILGPELRTNHQPDRQESSNPLSHIGLESSIRDTSGSGASGTGLAIGYPLNR